MHELSIALSIIDLAQEEAETRNARINAVHLKLGPLSGVVKEALLFSYDIACEGTSLEGSRLVIEEIPITGFCPQCQAPRLLTSLQSSTCRDCQAPVSQIIHGRELEVVALEIAS